MTLELVESDVARWVTLLVPSRQLAEVLSNTEFVPKSMRGKPDAIAAAILYGDELGLSPMQALASIHVVEGRPSPSAELKRALILRAGHSLVVHELTGTRVRVSGLRQGEPEADRLTITWDMDMARAAGLANKQVWREYPRAMLMARATDELARVKFPDVVKGLLDVADDLAGSDGWTELEPEPAPKPPRKAIQRTRKATPAPVADVELPSAVAPTVEPARPPVAPNIDPWSEPPPSAEASPVAPRTVVDTEDQPLPLEEVTGPPDETLPEEPLPDEPPVPPHVPRISPGPLKAMQTALTKELGTAATDDERHGMLSAILGRPITTAKDVTRAEGYDVLGFLARVAGGQATYDMDPESGAITVHDAALEPPAELEP